MERFKPWKELVLALKSIADAIEGKSSGSGGGEIDNTLYFDFPDIIINKNLDSTKIAFDVENTNMRDLVPSKLGDILNQAGVDVINDMFDKLIEKKGIDNRTYKAKAFIKGTSYGDIFGSILEFSVSETERFIGFDANDYYVGTTTDKFTVDTVMSLYTGEDDNQ